MKKIGLLITTLFFTLFLIAIELSYSPEKITITGDFTIDHNETIHTKQEDYSQIIIKDCDLTGKFGQAEIPKFSRLLALSDHGNYAIKQFSYETECIKLDKPLPPFGWEDEQEKNSNWYKQDNWFPHKDELISIQKPMIMRGIRFSQISVSPIQYNPLKNEIRLLKNLEITLETDLKKIDNPRKTKANHITRPFDEIAKHQIIGYESPRILAESSYLFILDYNCESELEYLMKWKNKLGFHTSYVQLDDIGNDNEDIRNYLQNLYDTSDNPPDFVVLIGDVNGNFTIPSNYVQGYYPPGSQDVTDHTYTLLDGDDYFPDILIGRLSVHSISEFQTIVNKIVQYESNPYTEQDWFDKALMVTYISDWGWEPFTSARETKMACREKLFNYNYTVVDTFFSPYQSSAYALSNKINEGYTFVNYRGAGAPGYWYEPYYTYYDVQGLSNGFMLPMVTSITCGGGDFASYDVTSCLGETFLKAGSPTTPKGAIGFIGPSEHDTKTQFNNVNDMGIYQGITQENLLRCGQMLLRGKMELYNCYPHCHDWGGSLDSDQFYFYVYNLLGDPGLQVWTHEPQPISYSMTNNLTTSSNFIEIQVNEPTSCEKSFVIAITDENDLLYTAETDLNGFAIVPISLAQGEYDVTLSSYGFIPKTTSFEVMTENQIVVTSLSTDQELICGNTVQINLELSNTNEEQTYEDIELILTSGDEIIAIENGEQSISELDSNETTTVTFSVNIGNEWQDALLTNLALHIHSTIHEQEILLPLELKAPQCVIASLEISNENLTQGEVSSLDINLQNVGSVNAESLQAELITRSEAIIDIENAYSDYPDISFGQSAINVSSFQILTHENVFTGETVFCELLLKQNNEVVSLVPFTLTVGEVDETSPTFCDYGYVAIESQDVIENNTYVEFDWIEIDPQYGGSGSLLSPDHTTADGYTSHVELPFTFRYFGDEYNEMYVCSEGYISLGNSDLVFHRNRFIPSGGGARAMIAPFWDDLTDGEVFYYFNDDEHFAVVQWSKMRNNYYQSYFETFQVVLYDPVYHLTETSDGEIKFQYHDIHNVDSYDNYATIGIENDSQSNGLLLTYSNIYPETVHEIENETAILITTSRNYSVSNDEDLVQSTEFMFGNYPNPFNPSTTIYFSQSQPIDYEICIYNIKGQKILQHLVENDQTGIQEFTWNGKDYNNQKMASGIYFYRIKSGSKSLCKKMLLLE